MDSERLYIVMLSCRVRDFFGVRRYYHCRKFEHVVKFCSTQQEEICGHFAEMRDTLHAQIRNN